VGVFNHAIEENSNSEQRIPNLLKAPVQGVEETTVNATEAVPEAPEAGNELNAVENKGGLERTTTERSFNELPSLVADESFMLSSQGSAIAPGELSTGLSLDLSDIKMGDSTEGGVHDPNQ